MCVLLVGDMALLWDGVADVLLRRGRHRQVARVPTIGEAVRQVARSNHGLAMVQSRLADGCAADAVRSLRAARKDLSVIVLGIGEPNDDCFLAALEEGASGFIDSTASFEDLLTCIRRVGAGDAFIPHRLAVRLAKEYKKQAPRAPEGPALTRRELEVLQFLGRGCSNKGIAQRLVVSEHTVRAHLRNIMDKLSVENRVQAVARATREGLLSTADLSTSEKDDATLIA